MITPRLIAHLDLKGLHLREGYYRGYFESLHQLGYDAVLIEYEDVFPYRSIRPAIDAEEVWSREFLGTFQALAEEYGIEIIPLQQCFGHLEYVFRWPEYAPFSLPHGPRPRELNIDSAEARGWFLAVVEEMLAAHPRSRFVHLGMDEGLSLAPYAAAVGREPLDLFLSYLEELCQLCAEHDKIPVIWSDMLEDHIAPQNIAKIRAFRDRVVLAHWNYFSTDRPDEVVRFSGRRCHRALADRFAIMRQPIDGSVQWAEDWPQEIAALAAPHQLPSGEFTPFFPAAVWKSLGFRVWGAGGAGITQDRRLLPYYHWRQANLLGWKLAAKRHKLDGLLVTQWGRSNSCAGPNLFPDVVLPLLEMVAREPGEAARFFPEIPWDQQERIFLSIGRCREDWRVEGRLIAEMESLSAQVVTHRYEWRTLILMLKILDWSKSVEDTLHLVDCYGGLGRMMPTGWERDREKLVQLQARAATLQAESEVHLDIRYQGRSLREWYLLTFDQLSERITTGLARIDESIHRAHILLSRTAPEAAR